MSKVIQLKALDKRKLIGTPDQLGRLQKAVQKAAATLARFTEPFVVDNIEYTVSYSNRHENAEILQCRSLPGAPSNDGNQEPPNEYSTVPVIKAYLKSKGIEFPSRANKAQLLKLLA